MPSVASPTEPLARRPRIPRFVEVEACGYCQGSGVDTKELYQLFPGGPGKLVARIAGLKKPTGCI